MGRKKVGRNEPCPCGSGKKYKKCHLGVDESLRAGQLPEPVLEWLARTEHERVELQRAGIYVNYVKPVIFQRKKVWALGDRVISSDNPHQTFHEFLLVVLIDTLGSDWLDAQQEQPYEERHHIAKCLVELEQWKRGNAEGTTQVGPHVFSVEPDGATLSVLSLAFDIATLRNILTLPQKLVARLRHVDQYQGARYEITLAAMFARIDCEISFFSDRATSTKHPEFVARFRPTGESVAVEGKSRHRPGVLHQGGDLDEIRAMRGDVGRLLREALEQDPGNQPFMVFVDLNSPLTPGVDFLDKSWMGDLKNLIDDYPVPTSETPDSLTLLSFTNFSYHYEQGVPASPGEYVSVRPLFVRHDVGDELLNRLDTALAGYGRIPSFEPEPEPAEDSLSD